MTKDLYDRIWDGKSAPAAAVPEPGSRADVAGGRLGKGEFAIEIGCGEGSFGAVIAGAYRRYAGFDISERAVGRARARGLDARAHDIGQGPLPVATGSADLVVALDVLEHVFDPPSFLAECARVLGPGGRLLLSTPNIRSLPRLATLALRGRFPRTSSDPGYDGGHLHYFTSRDLAGLAAAAGLQPLRRLGVWPRGGHHARLKRILAAVLPAAWVREWLAPGIFIEARKP